MKPIFSQPISSTSDRFIPTRSSMNKEISQYNLRNNVDNNQDMGEAAYKQTISQTVFGTEDGKQIEDYKILALKQKAPAPKMGYRNQMAALYCQNLNGATSGKGKPTRSICTTASKVLDAPGMVDDYYLNLLDWSDSNVVSIGLGSSVFLWNAETSDTCELLKLEDNNIITSVNFAGGPNSHFLSVGTSDNRVLIFDVTKGQQVRQMTGHSGRVGALAWNKFMLSSGSFSGQIINFDVRNRDPYVSTFNGHEGEICGLKWSNDGSQLASGGNDNVLNVWRSDLERPLFSLREHNAAVKAVAWCPWQNNLLASGGGSADRTIRFWNTATGQLLNTINTDSQVCSLQWSRHQKEIVSSHGFSKNQLCVWKYPSMTKVAELTGHTFRALHTAQSPCGTTILSASPDQTLRMWNVWEPKKKEAKKGPMYASKQALSSSAVSRIR